MLNIESKGVKGGLLIVCIIKQLDENENER